jgi:hypothetical protein
MDREAGSPATRLTRMYGPAVPINDVHFIVARAASIPRGGISSASIEHLHSPFAHDLATTSSWASNEAQAAALVSSHGLSLASFDIGLRFRPLNFLDSVVRTSRPARIQLGGEARDRHIWP